MAVPNESARQRHEARTALLHAEQEIDDLRDTREVIAAERKKLIGRAAVIVAAGGPRNSDDHTKFFGLTARAHDLRLREEKSEQLEHAAETRANDARVVCEPLPYGPGSPNSYYKHLGILSHADNGVDEALLRDAAECMARWDDHLGHEMRRGSPLGKRAVRAGGEVFRSADEGTHRRRVGDWQRGVESRAIPTGGGMTASASGGGAASFVSPAWLPEPALFNGYHRSFTDQCGTHDLPPWGMNLYAPSFTSAPTVSTSYSEDGSVPEGDPSMALLSAAVQPIAGKVTTSMALHERSAPVGYEFDKAIEKQLNITYASVLEPYVLTQAISGGTAVSGQSSFTIAGLYQDLAAAREVLTDTAGTRLRPTAVFTTSDLYSYVTRQVDDQHRPIVVPTFAPGFPMQAGDEPTQKWSRFTGTVMPGGVLWFEADGIPSYSTANLAQILVSAPDEAIIVAEGEPVVEVLPLTALASSLEVIFRLKAYVAVIVRYEAGTAVITGGAYTSSLI